MRNLIVAQIDMTLVFIFFFFNDTATTEIYTLSLHDALPIWCGRCGRGRDRATARASCRPGAGGGRDACAAGRGARRPALDRKSTRLNSSHSQISYAVFCLKKKKMKIHYLVYADMTPACFLIV